MTADNTAATAPTKNALAAREIAWAKNTPELLAQHAQVNATADGGTVIRTRFPPEPNGYLHLGHAKSINMNFSLAFDKLQVPMDKRRTVFRYDDTNPDAESQEYIDSFVEDLQWLGTYIHRQTDIKTRTNEQRKGVVVECVRGELCLERIGKRAVIVKGDVGQRRVCVNYSTRYWVRRNDGM